MQLCTMLYNDRVFAYETMVSIDPVLDSANDTQVSTYVDADKRNHLAHLELKNYEQYKAFLFLHPILLDYKKESEYRALLATNPAKFMQEITNINKNITRYQSLINTKKYKSEEERVSWLNIIKDCNTNLSIIQNILANK